MNEELNKLYSYHWDKLIRGAQGKNLEAAHPMLIKVNKDYINADIRVMIVGQETDTWNAKINIWDGNIDKQKCITTLQDTYHDFFYNKIVKEYSKSMGKKAFWDKRNFNFFREQLDKKYPDKKIQFIWNNVHKIGNAERKKGKPTNKIIDLEKKCFNVFSKELGILSPDIIIFRSGKRKIRIENKRIVDICDSISLIHLDDYPKIYALRAPHPSRCKKEIKKNILELICTHINGEKSVN